MSARFMQTRAGARLLLWVAALNVAGLACLSATTGARDPLAWQQSADGPGDLRSTLGSLGFTLMLPGSFFAAAIFLCVRVLVRSEAAARGAWYGAALLINLILAWRFGAADGAARS
ncbi:MAG TPA: hypothetical protein VF525_17530 [Pyrinomonadaceae bacterium]